MTGDSTLVYTSPIASVVRDSIVVRCDFREGNSILEIKGRAS